jgi:hypothetical protein
MNGRRVETHHNTPEQAREYLREALAIVAELDPPADMRAACFVKAVELVASKSITVEQLTAGLGTLAVPRGS